MKTDKLSLMKKGWFVGDFEPSVIKTNACEVGVKNYPKDVKEDAHYHLKADEITVIVTGKVKINGVLFVAGDIILIEKGEIAKFETLEETTTVVFKSGSYAGDKYLVE